MFAKLIDFIKKIFARKDVQDAINKAEDKLVDAGSAALDKAVDQAVEKITKK